MGLTGNSTAINLDQGFPDARNQLQLTPGAVSTYLIGQIEHVSSGLSLSVGGTTVEVNNLLVDPAFSRVHGDVVLEGTRVLISPDAAALLDQTLGTDP